MQRAACAMRFFNTTGPVVAADHYCVPPLARLDPDELLLWSETSATSCCTRPGRRGRPRRCWCCGTCCTPRVFRCVYANIEGGQTAREDAERAMRVVLGGLASWAAEAGDGFLDGVWPNLLARYRPDGALREALTCWSAVDARPLMLLIDEIDVLVDDSLLSALRQLRAGYVRRPAGFPQTRRVADDWRTRGVGSGRTGRRLREPPVGAPVARAGRRRGRRPEPRT